MRTELRERDALDLDVVRAHEDDAAVVGAGGSGEVALVDGLAAAAAAAAAVGVGLPQLAGGGAVLVARVRCRRAAGRWAVQSRSDGRAPL